MDHNMFTQAASSGTLPENISDGKPVSGSNVCSRRHDRHVPDLSCKNAGSSDRLQRIWEHPLFQECLSRIEELEKDRIFCGHDRTHLFDVARIAYIENLERGADIPRELIYAAALLHDIGRHLQYLEGTPHHEASAQIAEKILPECGFSETDSARILDAIRAHRDPRTKSDPGLSGLIYRADKRSRCCFACAAEADCDWEPAKKNMKWSV